MWNKKCDYLVELGMKGATELHVLNKVGPLSLVGRNDADLIRLRSSLQQPSGDFLHIGCLRPEWTSWVIGSFLKYTSQTLKHNHFQVYSFIPVVLKVWGKTTTTSTGGEQRGSGGVNILGGKHSEKITTIFKPRIYPLHRGRPTRQVGGRVTQIIRWDFWLTEIFLSIDLINKKQRRALIQSENLTWLFSWANEYSY